jgi:hypothetical protein
VLTANIGSYSDAQVGFKVVGTGAIVADDIRITNSAGQLFASENAEGPTLQPGPLNFQLTNAITLLTAANGRVVSSAAKDLNGDGHPETILTLVSPRPTPTPSQPIIIESSAALRVATSDFFPDGPPTVKDCPMILFADINGERR